MYSVIIIGGGLAGCSTAYQLFNLKDFKKKVLLIEAGLIGEGDNFKMLNTDKNESDYFYPWLSGTNVFDIPNRIKMIQTMCPLNVQDFVKHHGINGLKTFNKLSELGRDEQFKLAKKILRSDNSGNIDNTDVNKISNETGFLQLGCLMMCKKEELNDMYIDYKLLKSVGCEVDWYSKDKLQQIHGKDIDYHSGMFFPKDGVINSTLYCKKLIEISKIKGLEVKEKCTVLDYNQIQKNDKQLVEVRLENGEYLYCESLIVCTGGFFIDKYIAGLIKPSFSYITAIRSPIDNYKIEKENYLNRNESSINIKNQVNAIKDSKNTMNFQTHNFIYDWNMSQGWLRISGNDHYSANLKGRMIERCKELEEWAKHRYPFLRNSKEVKYINGVYSETPDHLPILGSVNKNSKIFYNLGCNAAGQATLSATSILILCLLGEKGMNKEEEEMINLIDIKRFRIGNNKFQNPKF